MGGIQAQLKTTPQLCLLVAGIIASISYFKNYLSLFKALFFSLFITALFIFLFALSNKIFWLLKPAPHIITEHRGMNMDWLNGLVVATLLTPVLAFCYKQFAKSNHKLEFAFCVWFTVQTVIILLLNKVF